MHSQKNAFTLVELIVAITIIAILGTIGAISLVRSNADARDAIRVSDTKSLARLLTLRINGERIGDVSEYIDTILVANTFSSGSVFNDIDITTLSYIVGEPATVKLGVTEAFIDPVSRVHYPLGIIKGEFGTYFQVAARLEDERALVQGNYFTIAGSDLSGIIQAFDSANPVRDGGEFLPYYHTKLPRNFLGVLYSV